jgi:hypothetical protein
LQKAKRFGFSHRHTPDHDGRNRRAVLTVFCGKLVQSIQDCFGAQALINDQYIGFIRTRAQHPLGGRSVRGTKGKVVGRLQQVLQAMHRERLRFANRNDLFRGTYILIHTLPKLLIGRPVSILECRQ